MRYLIAVAVAAVLLGLRADGATVAPVEAAWAATGDRCPPPRGGTIATNRYTRVYYPLREAPIVAACYRRTGARRSLGFADYNQPAGPRAIRLAGRKVAYDTRTCSSRQTCSPNSIVVLDARTGKRTRIVAPPAGVYVTALELRSDGAVAWIRPLRTRVADGVFVDTFEIRKRDRGGEVLLDQGAAIGLRSLRIAGSRVRWTKGGQGRSAALR